MADYGLYETTDFIANIVTIVIGGSALIGAIYHRETIRSIVRYIVNNHLNHNIRDIKDTLVRLDELSYSEKGDKRDILSLLGQLTGRLHALKGNDEIEQIISELESIENGVKQFSEPIKQKITARIRVQLGYLETQAQINTHKGK